MKTTAQKSFNRGHKLFNELESHLFLPIHCFITLRNLETIRFILVPCIPPNFRPTSLPNQTLLSIQTKGHEQVTHEASN